MSEWRPPDPMADGVQVWLVRHGETEWSRSGQHTGRTEVPLTARGEAQARALRSVFADLAPAAVLCSPRERARRTAELAGLGERARIEIDDDLAEWDYGDYEGLTSAEIVRADPGWTIFAGAVPGGEDAAAVRARADRVLTKAAGLLERGPVVLIGHGHFSRVLGARWIGQDVAGGARLQLYPAAYCVLGVEHAVPQLVRWNGTVTPAESDRTKERDRAV